MFISKIQRQLLSWKCVQIINSSGIDFPALLNQVENQLKQRAFNSQDVQNYYHEKLEEIARFIADENNQISAKSVYILFPFNTQVNTTVLASPVFFEPLIDLLTLIIFSDVEFLVDNNYINLKLNNKQIYGIYIRQGTYSLTENYVTLLKSLSERRIDVPGNLVCFIPHVIGDQILSSEKMQNIIVDIYGTNSFIQQLRSGNPICKSISSHIISEATSIENAKDLIRRSLHFD